LGLAPCGRTRRDGKEQEKHLSHCYDIFSIMFPMVCFMAWW
jgi:hypothetical protein